MNAIEYALVNDANLEVIKSMQRACRDDWRERSKGGSPVDCGSSDAPQSLQLGRRRHQELVRDMETMALKLQSEYTSNEGMNAIEYALVNDANLEVIKSMQRACRDDWRER